MSAEQSIEQLPGKWIPPGELYVAVRQNDLIRSRGATRGAEELERLIASSCVDAYLAAALGRTEILLGDDVYTISYIFRPLHAFGQGGRTFRASHLMKNGVRVLESTCTVDYTTYSDDSEDHESGRTENTFLLARDAVAEAVFLSHR